MSEATEARVPDAEESVAEDLNETWGDFLDESEPDEDAVFDEQDTPAPEVKEPESVEAEATDEVVKEGKAPEPDSAEAETPTETEATEKPEAVEQQTEEVVEEPPVEEPKITQRTPEEIQALRTQAQEDLRKAYELTPEEAENMLSEPEKVLPTLAAKVHMQVYEQVLQGMVAQLPQMVTGIIQQDRQVRSSEEAFFSRWPQLKGHQKQVAQVATLWRQLNPQAPTQEAIENIGKHAMIALGYPVGTASVQPIQENVTPSAPPPPAPLSSATPTPAPQKPKNQFEQLADELLIDEEDI